MQIQQDIKQIEDCLFSIFSTISQFVRLTDAIRSALISSQNFNPVRLFKTLAGRNEKFIYKDRLKAYCSKLLSHYSSSQFELMASLNKLYCTSDLQRFLRFIFPLRQSAIRECTKNVQIDIYNDLPLSQETLFIFNMLLQKQIQFASRLSNLRVALFNKKAGIRLIMSILKSPYNKQPVPRKPYASENIQSVSYVQLRRFLQSHNLSLDQFDMLNLIRRLHSSNQYLIQLPISSIQKWVLGGTISKNNQTDLKEKDLYQTKLLNNQRDPLLFRSTLKFQQDKRNIYAQYKDNLKQQLKNHMAHNFYFVKREQAESKQNCSNQFEQYFVKFVKGIRQIVNIRRKLIKREDFSIKRLFLFFDIQKKGLINRQNMSRGFKEQFYKQGMDLRILIKRFNVEPGILRFSDFKKILLGSYQFQQKGRQSTKLHKFSHQTNRLILQYFQLQIELQKQIMAYYPAIKSSLKHYFERLDQQRKGLINRKDLELFLKRQKIVCQESELAEVWIRLDQFGKGSLSQQQFRKAMF